nr:unnamed protein product [Callosobruchus analis]
MNLTLFIHSATIYMMFQKLKGTAQALQLLTTSKGTRYEFIFTNLVPGNTRHFTSVVAVAAIAASQHCHYIPPSIQVDLRKFAGPWYAQHRFGSYFVTPGCFRANYTAHENNEGFSASFEYRNRAYNSSKLYRELKLRGAVVQHKQLKILPQEQVFSTMHGVFNLSSDQGSLGTFIVTNICIRESKFGIALVITSSESSGGFILGFKVDPEDKMKILYKELTSLHTIYSTKPIFGVEYKWCSNKNLTEQNNNLVEDFDTLEDTRNEIGNTIASYLADEGHKDRPPVYSNELGLAIETLKEGYTLQKLWEVIPS